MITSVIETQLDGETKRVYELEGPQFETVRSFWAWLQDTGQIESYRIWRRDLS